MAEIAGGVLALAIAAGMVIAGRGQVRMARRMAGFAVARGVVVSRSVVRVAGGLEESPNFRVLLTYDYTVDGQSYRSDRVRYSGRDWGSRERAEREAAAYGGEVPVYYDPASPAVAFLHRETAVLGRCMMFGSAIPALIGAMYLLG